MSQVDGTTETIDGFQYTVMMLAPEDSIDLLVDIAKVIGPSLGKAADAAGDGDDQKGLNAFLDQEINKEFFSGIVRTMTDRLDKQAVRRAMKMLSEKTFVTIDKDGKTIKAKLNTVFAAHFLGRPLSILKWFAFALKVNYGNFFGALGGAFVQGQAKATQA